MTRPAHSPAARPPSALRAGFLFLALGLGACASEPKTEVDPEKQFLLYSETAVFHYANKEWERAESQALKALEVKPEDVKMRLMVPWCQLRRGTRDDVLGAEQAFRSLLSEGDYQAKLGLADALERKGILYDESAGAMERGERRPASGADPVARSVEFRKRAGVSWQESRGLYQEILATRPDDRSALNGLQRVLGLLRDYEQSLVYSARLLETIAAERGFWSQQLLRPDLTPLIEDRMRGNQRETRELEVRTHLYAASALRQLTRSEEALGHLNSVIELEPAMPEAYSRRADEYFLLGRFQEAIHDVDQFLRLSPHPFEHPDVRRAYELRSRCEAGIRSLASS